MWSVLPSTAALNEESLKGLLMGTMSGEDLLAQSFGSIPLNQATQGISLNGKILSGGVITGSGHCGRSVIMFWVRRQRVPGR